MMTLATVVLAGFVTFTPSATGMGCATCCLRDTVRLRDCYAVVLYAFGQQSPTWVAKRDSMLAFPAIFTRYWPAVRLEAAPRQVSSKAVCPPYPARDSLPYPDSLATRSAFVVTRNAAGGFCWSNVVVLR